MNELPIPNVSSRVWLGGTLANHRRGRILKNTVEAQPSEQIPSGHGICILFGSDFQEASEAVQEDWVTWSQEPGRVLLLIPPYKSMGCSVPKEWAAKRRLTPVTKKDNEFLNALSPEIQFELEGQLQIAQALGGTWDDQSLCTAYYRSHPHSGIFAITCLPLWSLLVLDAVDALRSWLHELSGLTGGFREEGEPAIEEPEFEPSKDHFILLLHLITAHFCSDEEALETLQSSPILSLDAAKATHCLHDLELHGLVEKSHLTEAGRQLLVESQYAHFAEELEALAQ
jgi:hypothetical protein